MLFLTIKHVSYEKSHFLWHLSSFGRIHIVWKKNYAMHFRRFKALEKRELIEVTFKGSFKHFIYSLYSIILFLSPPLPVKVLNNKSVRPQLARPTVRYTSPNFEISLQACIISNRSFSELLLTLSLTQTNRIWTT